MISDDVEAVMIHHSTTPAGPKLTALTLGFCLALCSPALSHIEDAAMHVFPWYGSYDAESINSSQGTYGVFFMFIVNPLVFLVIFLISGLFRKDRDFLKMIISWLLSIALSIIFEILPLFNSDVAAVWSVNIAYSYSFCLSAFAFYLFYIRFIKFL